MDLSDLGLVVVQKPDALVAVTCFEDHFLLNFAVHGLKIRGLMRILVLGADVPPDADGSLAVR